MRNRLRTDNMYHTWALIPLGGLVFDTSVRVDKICSCIIRNTERKFLLVHI